ncbi:hypothetical protein ASE40_17185 [Flavobacterium sp. Root935]|jgi:hypothetical protein|uniref:hypothetical protein n=1 Tax=unclassified Flavobacterium TaxID=196869 RepID=UPI00070FDB6A|nr:MULTISPECIES: hypothetical protein [unclassified Flavobacterium]KRD58074.1 hypothetical protein ASE40_17185 [Flavobacterium sp. Root935]TDX10726.1 hypothetical protein EDB96_3137 [Flavobacterium sp. S87F.05.LMB.W.Kidney.N]
MKSFRLKSVLVVLFLSIAFVSCNNDDDEKPVNQNTKAALVTEIKGPATGKVNDELSYEVTYIVDNACAEFDKISEVTIGTEKGLQVIAKYPSEVCTQQVPEPKKTVYKFKSTVKGTFEIKFKKSETEFLTQKVVIE